MINFDRKENTRKNIAKRRGQNEKEITSFIVILRRRRRGACGWKQCEKENVWVMKGREVNRARS